MRGLFLPLGEWFRIVSNVFSGYPVSPVHINQNLPFLCTWGERWCAPPVVMYVLKADDSIYESISLVGNLSTIIRVGIGIIICT